jgi:hypothetical protein
MVAISLANSCISSVAALNTRPQQREFVDFETREPRFHGYLKEAPGLIGREDENGDMYVRELETRDPKFFGFLKKAAGLVLREDENMYGRELDARDPKFFGILKKAAGLVLREDENGEVYVARDYDDIDAREPRFGFLKKVAGLVLREAPEFDALD